MTAFPATPLFLNWLFLGCLATLVFGALLAVFSARLIRSVCGLAVCCVGLAGLYYFLHSPFLALMEVLIYVGAVCVTIVFAVMLAEPEEPSGPKRAGPRSLWGGLAFADSGQPFLPAFVGLATACNWSAPGWPGE